MTDAITTLTANHVSKYGSMVCIAYALTEVGAWVCRLHATIIILPLCLGVIQTRSIEAQRLATATLNKLHMASRRRLCSASAVRGMGINKATHKFNSQSINKVLRMVARPVQIQKYGNGLLLWTRTAREL